MENNVLAKEDMLDVALSITPTTADLQLHSQMSKAQVAVETLLYTYADLTTDGLLIVKYFAEGRTAVGTLMLAMLAFSLVVQAGVGHVSGQGRCRMGKRRGRGMRRHLEGRMRAEIFIPGLTRPLRLSTQARP